MGRFLNKLGAFTYQHKWTTLGGWLVVAVILGLGALTFAKPPTGEITIPGTEAQITLDRAAELFPSIGLGSTKIVFKTSDSITPISDYKVSINDLVQKVEKIDGVTGIVSPFDNPTAISTKKDVAFAEVQLSGGVGSVATTTISELNKAIGDTRTSSGLTVEVGGGAVDHTPTDILGVGEIAGVVLALFVLVLTLGSLVSAGMPIVIALTTIAISMAGLFSLSEMIEIGSTTPVLAVMLGLAVGIDYSLFIVSRYKSYLLEGYGYQEAAGRAIGTAGSAVIFAALTVVIALSSLVVIQIPFMAIMGLTGAFTVGLASIVAVTLIPALLGFAGDKIFRQKTRLKISTAQAQGVKVTKSTGRTTVWYKWGKAITKRPVLVLIVAVLAIVAIAWPAFDIKLGLPTDQFAAVNTSQRKAYDILEKGFGVGFNAPLLVVVEGLPAVTDTERNLVRQQIMAKSLAPPITNLSQPQMKEMLDQQVERYSKLANLSKVANRIATVDDVAYAVPALISSDESKGLIQVIPKSAPSDLSTIQLISYIRNKENQKLLTGDKNTSLAVTGATALQLDINNKLAQAVPLYLTVIIGLSLVLLFIAFRSVLIPIKATLGFLLSVLAMFGALVTVFQWGWFGIAEAPGPIVSFIPIIATGILFGLAMDYEFFIVSSMHESYNKNGDARLAVKDGFGLGSKVVTAAGVIMIAIFAGFIFNHDATIQALGFGLAVGILVDAFVVRMTIVPAVMTLLGKSAWWLPKWVDRLMPHVPIDGEVKPPLTKKHE